MNACDEAGFLGSSEEVSFCLPRIKGIEKLMEGAGFMIVVSRQIMGMIYTVTGEK